ncbi:YbjP/YqhG family protein [Actinoallomurus purpureus]|nr:YbjP/YqhG family protein [Actinoallomurus purpureus]MCO6004905.1 YbjP/YqhG family protein [Actinoallomurus purpureus]
MITVLAASAAIAYGAIAWTHQDEAQIRKTVEKFAHTADREDRSTMISMLCEEEAEAVIADGEPSSDNRVLDPDHERPIKVSNIRVTGDVAQARVTRPAQHPATLYLRKEAGTWKLCDPERYTPYKK